MSYHEMTRCRHKAKANKVVTPLLLAVAIAGLLGCGMDDDSRTGDRADPTPVGRATPSPIRVASLELKTGQVLDFYDFTSSALIVESANAYVAPVLDSASPASADQLVGIWTRLAPEQPVPPALDDLQSRLTSLPLQSDGPPVLLKSETGGNIIERVITDAPVGCSNGCCDAAWLATLGPCKGSHDYSWFLYNGGWSWADSRLDEEYDGLVCSAQGTSTFSVSIGGSGGTWSVPEATWRSFHWSGGGSTLFSNVNSSSDQHLHTYCGGIIYD